MPREPISKDIMHFEPPYSAAQKLEKKSAISF